MEEGRKEEIEGGREGRWKKEGGREGRIANIFAIFLEIDKPVVELCNGDRPHL